MAESNITFEDEDPEDVESEHRENGNGLERV